MDWIKISLTEKQKQELQNAKKQIGKPQLIKRIECLQLKNKGWKHQEVADFLDICIDTISNWLKIYQKHGLQKLLEWNYEGKISILTLENQKKLKKINSKKPFDTAKKAKAYIKEHFNIDFHLHWVQKLLKKNFDFRIRIPK